MTTKFPALRNFSTRRGFLAGFVIVTNTYSWFFPLYILYEEILSKTISDYVVLEYIIGVHYLAAVLSAFIGVFLVNRIKNRDRILILWMIIGILSSLLLMVSSEINNYAYLGAVSFLLGTSLGLGFPSSLAYFADYNVDNKGRRAGVTFLVSGFGILILGLMTVSVSFMLTVAIFTMWRMVGCVLFILLRPQEKKQLGTIVSYKTVLQEKAFILYLVPWVMFCLINYLEASLLKGFFGSDFSYLVPMAEFGIGGVVAFVAGYLSDLIGRKIVIAAGYVLLGLGYALLGLFPSNIISWYSYVIVDGIAFGVFALTFFLVTWGELAADRNKEIYYLIGELPYLTLSYLGIIIKPHIQLIPVSSAFSLAAFFLFLAVLPLMYAPETLPEKKIKDRELKKYVEKAKKVKEKYT